MHTSLRIKQRYFDQIAEGTKDTEYRAASDYYRRILIKDEPITSLTLHYQRAERLTCKVLSIKEIDTPSWIDKANIDTKRCIAIKLSNPRRWLCDGDK